ncbi:MAG: glycosyltransferase family 2 protein [Gammaproteobacteria bacterium]|nr:glycosyltransferase family 2 protein [Gammaproteobacteria bacterium]
MYKDHTVGVVVPAYNEETQIGKVIESMPDYVDHIVIVNDLSTDLTAQIVEEYAENNAKIVLINHEQNQGVGGAIASGYKWMRDNDIDTATVMAGDAQMNPKDLPNLLDPVIEGRADYSKGNRLIYANAYQVIPRIRFWGNAMLSFLTKIASGYWHVADSQTGYAVINKTALRVIDWDKMFKGYGQPNDVLVKLNVHSFRVVDVPVEPVYNVGEESGIKIRKVVFSISWLLVKLFFWRLREKYVIRDFHPLVLFYAFGFGVMGISIALFVRLVWKWSASGLFPEVTALAFIFTFLSAVQSFFFAMWLDSEHNKPSR